MSKDKLVRISETTHKKLEEIGKGESFDDTISKLLEDALFWRRFRIDFIMKVILPAEDNPENKVTYGELRDFFVSFLGRYHFEKMSQWLEEAGYK